MSEVIVITSGKGGVGKTTTAANLGTALSLENKKKNNKIRKKSIGGSIMSEVIVITSGKGGVGKTTTAANLGTALSLENKKTVIVDADIGLRNLDVVMGLENRIVYDIVDVVEGTCRLKQALIKDKRFDNLYLLPAAQTRDKNAVSLENRIVYDIVDVVEGTCRLKQALIKDKRFDNLYLLPAAQTRDKNAVSVEQMEDLCEKDVVEGTCRLKQALIKDKRFDNLYLLPAAQTRDKNAVSVEQMEDLCEKLKESFDFILIDCPAGIEQGFKNAVAGATRAIVVTNPEVSAVRDADRIIGLLEANEIKDIRLVINRIRQDMVRRGDMMDKQDILEILAIDLLGLVPDDESIIVSTNKGEPAILDSKSLAGQAYKNIAKRILGEDIPLIEVESDNTLFSKIKKMLGMAK